VALVKERLLFL
ncbi:hypothetical protein M514_28164, partial [Trichuris suis]